MSKGKRAKVLLVYKSGATVEIECDEFSVGHDGPEITSVRATNAVPKPLHYGIEELAAVYHLNPPSA
jgi:hypothetical protein